MSTLWISKPGLVTLVTSVALHAAAVAFVGTGEAHAFSRVVAPKLLDVDVVQEVRDDAPQEADPDRRPVEVKPSTVHAPAVNVRGTGAKAPGGGAAAASTPEPEPEPAPSPEMPAVPAHFVMAAPVTAFAQKPGAGSSGAEAGVPGGGESPFDANQVSTPASLLTRAAVVYPAEARAQEIETDVRVEIVVDESGRVIAARSLSNAGYGMDEAALRAIRQYRFSPATKDGHAVRVRMRWTVQFRLG